MQQRDIEVEEKPDGTITIRIGGTVVVPTNNTKIDKPARRR